MENFNNLEPHLGLNHHDMPSNNHMNMIHNADMIGEPLDMGA